MFRASRILSILFVTALGLLGLNVNLSSFNKLSREQVLIVSFMILLGLINILVEILDHRSQKKRTIKRQEEFLNLKYQLSRPILPFTLHSVLKYTTKQSIIQNTFASQIEEFQTIIDRHKQEGKFISPDLIDFPWDENHQVNEYILCRMESEILKNLLNTQNADKHHLLKYPFSSELKFYKKGKKGHSSEPDIQLRSGFGIKGQSFKVVDLRLYNDNLYLESFAYDWTIEHNTNQFVSVYDFRGAMLKLKFVLLTYDEDDFEKHPYFTVIQLKCGDHPFNIIELDLKTLGKPQIMKNEGFHFEGNIGELFGNILTICYEIILPENYIESHMQQFN